MATTDPLTADVTRLFGDLKKNWGWMLALGIVFVILGTVGLGMTVALTLASVVFFGVLILIGGGVQLFNAFQCKGWKGTIWHVLIALLYIAAGVLMISRPLMASTVITAMLAGAILVVGVLRIMMAFQIRGQRGWGWLLFAGLVSLALGLVILAKWPVSGLWVIGLFVAIEMIMHGWSYIFLALAVKNAPVDSRA